MRRIYCRPGEKNDLFVGINPNRVLTAMLLQAVISDPSTHRSEGGKNFISLSRGTVALMHRFEELTKYGYASTCFPFPEKEIQTDLEASKNERPNHGEMIRTIGALEIIGLLLKADESDENAEAAHYQFNAPQRKPDGSLSGEISLSDFAEHASRLRRVLVDNPGSLDALCTAIVMSDLGKFPAFREAAKAAGVRSTDPDHDVFMEHVLRELSDDALGEICPSFGRLSERQKFLVRCMFELELNPGWVLQGEASPAHIGKFLLSGATLDGSYIVEPKAGYLDQLGWGEVDTKTSELVKILMAYGVFFADISGARRHLGKMGSAIMNGANYGNYKTTILGQLFSDATGVDEVYQQIVLGQAHQGGMFVDKEHLTAEETTFVRLSQLTRITQNSGKGWKTEDLMNAWESLDDVSRDILIRNLGKQQDRSFTVTYLPGIAGRLTDLADTDSNQSRSDTLAAILMFYRNTFESLEALPDSLKGDLRVDGSWIRFDPRLTPLGHDASEDERLRAGIAAFRGFRVKAMAPSVVGGTVRLADAQ